MPKRTAISVRVPPEILAYLKAKQAKWEMKTLSEAVGHIFLEHANLKYLGHVYDLTGKDGKEKEADDNR